MKQVNVGMISYAHIHAEFRTRALLEIPEVKIIAIADDNKMRGEEVAKKYGIKNFYQNYIELLKRDDIDFVFIHSENYKHAEQVIAAAEYGKDIFCEKPIATTLKDAKRMLDAIRKNKVRFTVGFCSRYMPEAEYAKKIIDENVIGNILVARSLIGLSGPKEIGCPDYMVEWITDPIKAGGGAFIDEGSHAIDLLRWYLGDIKSVGASITTLSSRSLKVDDNGIAWLNFKNGAIGEVYSSWTLRLDIGMRNIVELYGDEGTLIAELTSPSPMVKVYTEKNTFKFKGWVNPYIMPEVISPHFYLNWPSGVIHYRREVRDIIKCYLEEKPFRVTEYDGLASLEAVLAAYESARTGKEIELPLKENGE
jgi:predicted dehydrogenase